MKIYYILCHILVIFTACSTHTPIESISGKEFQDNLRKEYFEINTPLKEDDLENFKGLDFFPIRNEFKVTAKFEKLKSNEIITMKTSKNLSKQYKKYGKISFPLQGKTHQLFVYQPFPENPKYKDYLFLPFRDETTGVTSYGAGRYMDISVKDIKGRTVEIDFNKSYNPYCAYSKHYNCPFTPYENTLDISVEAGIRYIYSDYE